MAQIKEEKEASATPSTESEAEATKAETTGAEIPEAEAAPEGTGAGGTKKHRKKRKAVYFVGVILAVLLLAYGGIAFYFQSHFLPYSTVNGMDCANLEAADVVPLLEKELQSYTLEVVGRTDEEGGRGVIGEIRAGDIMLAPEDAPATAEQLLSRQNIILWPEVFINHSVAHYKVTQGITFDEALMEQCVDSWDACQDKNTIRPRDAYLGDYSEKDGGYVIVPETKGTQIDREAMLEQLGHAVLTQETSLDLDALGCYVEADVTSEDKALNDALREANLWLDTRVTYDWNGNEVVVDGELIRGWITIDGNQPVLDEEAVAEFVSDAAREWDTYGKKRKFMTTLGVELSLPSGAYGWKTDREGETEELIQLIYQGSVLEKEPLYISRGAHKGSNDIGDSYVEADLTNQHLYLYQDGNLVLESDFVSGNMSKSGRMTPPGVFGLTYKTTKAVLRGDDYETPVNYWMPFNGNVGMHDATWRAAFGGDIYLTSGSHGCINLPLDKAAEIYQYVYTGFPVICYYY